MKFFDMFGGIGGFRLGLERALEDYECVGYLDNDKFSVRSYNQIFGEDHEPRDAREVRPEEIPEIDLLCAGFPCQSFSIAGKREGFEDTRGTLFFEIARIARGKLPEVLLLENVKGLLNHSNGSTFRKVLETLDELGYFVEWQVLNSKHFGVPQNRERVFIVGHLGGEPRRKVFPLRGEDGEDSGEDGGEGSMKEHPALTGAIGRAGSSKDYLRSLKVINQVREDEKKSEIQGYSAFLPNADYVDLVDNHAKNVFDKNLRIRKLTPRECWRLQGFPDWAFERAEEVNSDTQLYKQAANAVTVNVVEVIGRKLMEVVKS